MEKICLNSPKGKCLYYPEFINRDYTKELTHSLNWDQSQIKIFGKIIPIPRLNAWYADPDIHYMYSGHQLKHNDWTPLLMKLKSQVEEFCFMEFNSCLINLYREGKDYVSWHSDDEPELGPDPFIATLSFGGTRKFQFRENKQKKLYSVEVESGSLMLTCDGFHNYYKHQIAPTKTKVDPRISLTFRQIIP